MASSERVMKAGDRVEHYNFGSGTVKLISAHVAMVQFDEWPNPRSVWTGQIRHPQPKKPDIDVASKPLRLINAADFHGRNIPPREFYVPGFIPHRNVTLLLGDGGAGKSLIALQLGVGTALSMPWLDLEVMAGLVLYLSAEDEEDEHHRRLGDIVAPIGARLSDLSQLTILALAGEDAVLAAPEGRSEIIKTTALWRRVIEVLDRLNPRLFIVDNLADVFAGNENSRPQARQFITLLRGEAIKRDMTVLVLAHPSLTGISSGSGTSGSTGWSNSVRSRLYLSRILREEDRRMTEPDPDVRELTVMKMNYAQVGTSVRVRWVDGAFERLEDGAQAGSPKERDDLADAAFMSLLRWHETHRINISPKPSNIYAPTVFASHSLSNGISKRGFKTAMERLFAAGSIETIEEGPPSKPRYRIVVRHQEHQTDE